MVTVSNAHISYTVLYIKDHDQGEPRIPTHVTCFLEHLADHIEGPRETAMKGGNWKDPPLALAIYPRSPALD